MTTAFKGGVAKEQDIAGIPPFLFCRFLSGSSQMLQAVNILNRYNNIPIQNQYQFIRSLFHGKVRYVKYPKGEKEENPEYIDYLMDYFKISRERAREYLGMIEKDELDHIVKIYKVMESHGKPAS